MRRHLGLVAFGVSVLLAVVLYVVLVRPIRADIGELNDRIRAVNLRELAERAKRNPRRADDALLRLRKDLEEALPAPDDPWTRLELDGVPDAATFKSLFRDWITTMRNEGILTAGAWPRAAWRSGPTLPSLAEKDATARLMLLVGALGRGLRKASGTRIIRVTPARSGDGAEIGFEFDPTDAGNVLDPLLGLRIGDETSEILELTTRIEESGSGRGSVRIRTIDPSR